MQYNLLRFYSTNTTVCLSSQSWSMWLKTSGANRNANPWLVQNKIGSGKLMGPKGVSVDRNGHIIVVDNKACCVFIFQPNGKLVTKFGNRGNGDRQFAGTLNGNMCTAPYSLSPTSSHLHVEWRRMPNQEP